MDTAHATKRTRLLTAIFAASVVAGGVYHGGGVQAVVSQTGSSDCGGIARQLRTGDFSPELLQALRTCEQTAQIAAVSESGGSEEAVKQPPLQRTAMPTNGMAEGTVLTGMPPPLPPPGDVSAAAGMAIPGTTPEVLPPPVDGMIDMAGVPLGMPGAALQGSAPTDVAGTAADGNSPDRQALQEQVATLTAERDAAQRMASEAVAQAEERIAAISVELENARAAIQAAQEEAQQTRRDAVETILYFKQQGGQAHTAAPAQQEVRPEDTGEEQAPEATQGGGIDFGSTGLDMGKEESCSWFWNFVWGC